MNSAAERIFGWAEAEVLGNRLPFIPPESLLEYDRLRQRIHGVARVGHRLVAHVDRARRGHEGARRVDELGLDEALASGTIVLSVLTSLVALAVIVGAF